MTHKIIATLALVMTTTAVTFATGTLSVPHQFRSGDPAVAAEVNENFQALADAINAIGQKIASKYEVADDFATTPVTGLVAGTQTVIDGFTYDMKASTSVSFQESNNTQYTLNYPGQSSSFTYVTILNSTSVAADAWKKKTTISGYPTAVGMYFSNDSSTGCRVKIKLDGSTFALFQSNYPDTLSVAAHKEDQNKAIAHCVKLLNYLSVTTS